MELTFFVLGRATGLAPSSARAVRFLGVRMRWHAYSFSLGKAWDAGLRQNPHLGPDLEGAGVFLTLCMEAQELRGQGRMLTLRPLLFVVLSASSRRLRKEPSSSLPGF